MICPNCQAPLNIRPTMYQGKYLSCRDAHCNIYFDIHNKEIIVYSLRNNNYLLVAKNLNNRTFTVLYKLIRKKFELILQTNFVSLSDPEQISSIIPRLLKLKAFL